MMQMIILLYPKKQNFQAVNHVQGGGESYSEKQWELLQ